MMKMERFADAESAAREAARQISAAARLAVGARGRALIAFSGGGGALPMLKALAREDLPWDQVHVFQVDERVAPSGDADRNFTHLRDVLLNHVPLAAETIHPMPVEDGDLAAAARRYAATLATIAGSPPVLDLVHLGLGPDGHTASLVPGDRALDIENADVAISGPYQGRLRMTLTYPVLNRARAILWFVTGGEKKGVLNQLAKGDRAIPAGRVSQTHATVISDL